MKISFDNFLQIHSEKLYKFYQLSEHNKYPGKSTSRVMQSRIRKLKLRYDAIQELEDSDTKQQYLFAAINAFKSHNLELAIKRLNKAEIEAKRFNDYYLLARIYDIKLDYAEVLKNINFEKLFDDIKVNQEKILQYQSRQLLFAEIKKNFIAFLHQENEHHLETVLNSVVLKYTATLEEVLTIENIHQLLIILDTLGSVNHKFGSLDLFFESKLLSFVKQKGSPPLFESLYIIGNIAFRSGDLDKAKQYITMFAEKSSEIKTYVYKDRYFFLLSLINCFEGELDLAIVNINLALHQSNINHKTYLNSVLVKAMYLLLKGDFKSALSTINEFNRSDQHYIRVIGKEWLIYQYLLFILIHYERENYDIAENKIKVLLRKYHTFLNQKSSIGVFAYIKLIKRIIEGYQIKPKQLDDYFQLHFEEIENNNTDVFLKSFYAWVKAKVYKKSTYTTLLELLSNEKAKATGNYT